MGQVITGPTSEVLADVMVSSNRVAHASVQMFPQKVASPDEMIVTN
jgi:hypothetical protein